MITFGLKRRLALLFLLLLPTACGKTPATNFETSSFFLAGNYWADYTAIPVCVLNRKEFDETLLQDYRSIVEKEYYSKTPIRFSRWDDCTADDDDKAVVRIRLDSSTITVYTSGYWGATGGRSRVGAIALPLDGEASATMRLEAPKVWADYSKPGNNFFLHEVLHEFGHVLGLMHEHQRTDATQSCVGDAAAELAGKIPESSIFVYSGDYDKKSVMSYCNPLSNVISEGDVRGILGILRRAAAAVPASSSLPSPLAID